MTMELPVPQALLNLVECGCKTRCQSEKCFCRQAGLNCTELCSYSDEEQPFENVTLENDEEADEDKEDE